MTNNKSAGLSYKTPTNNDKKDFKYCTYCGDLSRDLTVDLYQCRDSCEIIMIMRNPLLLAVVLLLSSCVIVHCNRLLKVEYHTKTGAFEPGCARSHIYAHPSHPDQNITVSIRRFSSEPVISSQYKFGSYGSSRITYNYNAAYVPIPDGSGGVHHALLLRCQNRTESGKLTPSFMPLAIDATGENQFVPVDDSMISFQPNGTSENFGTEDPRIVYDYQNKTWILFYTAAVDYNGVRAYLAMASTTNILSPSAWVRHGNVTGQSNARKSAALILKYPYSESLLIFNDQSLNMAKPTFNSLYNWTLSTQPFMTTRSDHFDSTLVEGGPHPELLANKKIISFYIIVMGFIMVYKDIMLVLL